MVVATELAIFAALFLLNAVTAVVCLFQWFKRGRPKYRVVFSGALAAACGLILASGVNELWRERCAAHFVAQVVADLRQGYLPKIDAQMRLLDLVFLEQCRGHSFPEEQTINMSSAVGPRCSGEVRFPSGEKLLVDFHDMRIYPWWRPRYFATPEFALVRAVLIPNRPEAPLPIRDV